MKFCRSKKLEFVPTELESSWNLGIARFRLVVTKFQNSKTDCLKIKHWNKLESRKYLISLDFFSENSKIPKFQRKCVKRRFEQFSDQERSAAGVTQATQKSTVRNPPSFKKSWNMEYQQLIHTTLLSILLISLAFSFTFPLIHSSNFCSSSNPILTLFTYFSIFVSHYKTQPPPSPAKNTPNFSNAKAFSTLGDSKSPDPVIYLFYTKTCFNDPPGVQWSLWGKHLHSPTI